MNIHCGIFLVSIVSKNGECESSNFAGNAHVQSVGDSEFINNKYNNIVVLQIEIDLGSLASCIFVTSALHLASAAIAHLLFVRPKALNEIGAYRTIHAPRTS